MTPWCTCARVRARRRERGLCSNSVLAFCFPFCVAVHHAGGGAVRYGCTAQPSSKTVGASCCISSLPARRRRCASSRRLPRPRCATPVRRSWMFLGGRRSSRMRLQGRLRCTNHSKTRGRCAISRYSASHSRRATPSASKRSSRASCFRRTQCRTATWTVVAAQPRLCHAARRAVLRSMMPTTAWPRSSRRLWHLRHQSRRSWQLAAPRPAQPVRAHGIGFSTGRALVWRRSHHAHRHGGGVWHCLAAEHKRRQAAPRLKLPDGSVYRISAAF